MRRASFSQQIQSHSQRVKRPSLLAQENDKIQVQTEIGGVVNDVTAPFKSKFAPSDMRQLALVAHNHMKPAMKEFIDTYSEVLMKFRITGTQTTMRMCKSMWGEDNPKIEYGLTCTSGPLGGDAQIAALMCMEDLGALIFFVDPLSAHPHQADIDSLMRLSNCGNIIVCPNPASAMSMMHTFKGALRDGSRGMIPSFFQTLESPAVAEYKHQQELALVAAVTGKPTVPAKSLISFHPDVLASYKEEEDEEDDEFFGKVEEDEEEDVLDKVEEVESELTGFKFEKEQSVKRMTSASTLYGIVEPQKKKKKKAGVMKKIRKSIF